MKFEVPTNVLEETTECPSEFSCLTTGKCGNCEVESIGGKNIIFLKSKENINCPYNLTLGHATLCRCPTHYAILKNPN